MRTHASARCPLGDRRCLPGGVEVDPAARARQPDARCAAAERDGVAAVAADLRRDPRLPHRPAPLTSIVVAGALLRSSPACRSASRLWRLRARPHGAPALPHDLLRDPDLRVLSAVHRHLRPRARWPVIIIAWAWAVVAMVLNTVIGLNAVPEVLVKVRAQPAPLAVANVSARRYFPAATPYVFTGFKLAASYTVIGVIASEFIQAESGVGWFVGFSYNNFADAEHVRGDPADPRVRDPRQLAAAAARAPALRQAGVGGCARPRTTTASTARAPAPARERAGVRPGRPARVPGSALLVVLKDGGRDAGRRLLRRHAAPGPRRRGRRHLQRLVLARASRRRSSPRRIGVRDPPLSRGCGSASALGRVRFWGKVSEPIGAVDPTGSRR